MVRHEYWSILLWLSVPLSNLREISSEACIIDQSSTRGHVRLFSSGPGYLALPTLEFSTDTQADKEPGIRLPIGPIIWSTTIGELFRLPVAHGLNLGSGDRRGHKAGREEGSRNQHYACTGQGQQRSQVGY